MSSSMVEPPVIFSAVTMWTRPKREQCVIAGDTQPQEREAPGNRSEYSGCTLSDRWADPGIEDRTAEEQKDAGSDQQRSEG